MVSPPKWTNYHSLLDLILVSVVLLVPASGGEDKVRTHVTCPVPRLEKGRVTLLSQNSARIYPGDMANLDCDKDFELKLNDFLYSYSYIKCSENGQWTTPHGFTLLPTCQAKVCGNPPTVANSKTRILGNKGRGTVDFRNGSQAIYECDGGYILAVPQNKHLLCSDGHWQGEIPICQKLVFCSKPPNVEGSDCTTDSPSEHCASLENVEEGVKVFYTCRHGAQLFGDAVLQCVGEVWYGDTPQCVPRRCPSPPLLNHGDMNTYPATGASKELTEGSQAVYYCNNGYEFEDGKKRVEIVCRRGKWIGHVPACVKRLNCNMPESIEHGNWVIIGQESKFSVGMKIMYECAESYMPYGKTTLTCLDGYWSDEPPSCFPKATYCGSPGEIENGRYVCIPSPCGLFSVETTISYVCNRGYELVGSKKQICQPDSLWSESKPVCMPTSTTPRMQATLGINSSTMTVVIATSCSVLGLLLVVMIVVALQRRKQSPRLCHPVQPPQPPCPRPRSDSLDEHDRAALIAFADGVQVVLPSYEEATRGRGSSRFHNDTPSLRRGDYRPLPTIPANMRATSRLDSPRSGPVGPDFHRNSIITYSSTGRDNISLAFGSMDTMNISDGTSTSVTIETFDSGASNPSIALSQRAVTGSLRSSNGSLANEDAPLLDNISESGHTSPPARGQPEAPTTEEPHKQE